MVKLNLSQDSKIEVGKYYKDETNSSSVEEIILMSKCKNHIISNSSFSWWGTWLCQKNDQINISPKKWDNTKSDITNLIENFINL